jgi:hypothetical protein
MFTTSLMESVLLQIRIQSELESRALPMRMPNLCVSDPVRFRNAISALSSVRNGPRRRQ